MSARTWLRHGLCGSTATAMLVASGAAIAPSASSAQGPGVPAVVQETSARVRYAGGWTSEDTQRRWSGGTAAVATTPFATATMDFAGIGVSMVGFRGPQAGIARVFLDGALAATIDLFATVEQVGATVFTATALADASHTLTVEVTGDRNPLSIDALVVVDAFEIVAGVAGLSDTTPPAVTVTSPHPGAVIPTGLILRAAASDDFAVTRVRFFVDGEPVGDPIITAPYWASLDTRGLVEGPHTLRVVAEDAAGNTGTADIPVTVDRTPPELAITAPADGSTVSGMVTIAAGISDNVGVDGVSFSVNSVRLADDMAPPFEFLWDTTLVPDGPYTVKAAARDRAGGLNSRESTVAVSNGTTRLQDTSGGIAYTGTWAQGNTARAWSGGTAAIATLTAFPAQAIVHFEGTGVSWIGFRGPQAGIATVHLDGVCVATVDLFDPIEHVEAVVYSVNGLPPGPHSLIVQATGTRNILSTDPFVVVDAFIVFQR